MKKFTSLSFMLIAALLMFASCSKDDDGAPALDASLLEGTWIAEKTVNVTGKETTTEDDQTIYSFNANKTYTVQYTDGEKEEGTYTLVGNILSLHSDGFTLPYEIKALTSGNLNLYSSLEIEMGEMSIISSQTIYLARDK